MSAPEDKDECDEALTTAGNELLDLAIGEVYTVEEIEEIISVLAEVRDYLKAKEK